MRKRASTTIPKLNRLEGDTDNHDGAADDHTVESAQDICSIWHESDYTQGSGRHDTVEKTELGVSGEVEC